MCYKQRVPSIKTNCSCLYSFCLCYFSRLCLQALASPWFVLPRCWKGLCGCEQQRSVQLHFFLGNPEPLKPICPLTLGSLYVANAL